MQILVQCNHINDKRKKRGKKEKKKKKKRRDMGKYENFRQQKI